MKDKKIVALFIGIVLLLILLAYLKTTQKKPVSWTPTFENTDTNPYGAYITYELLGDIFEKKNIRSTRKPIYNNLKASLQNYFYYEDNNHVYNESYDDSDWDYETDSLEYANKEEVIDTVQYDPMSIYHDKDLQDTTSYIFVNTRFDLDKVDLEYLLDFVGLGNNAFISAEQFSYLLMDTLRIEMVSNYFSNDTLYTLRDYPNKKYAFKTFLNNIKFNTDSCKLPVRLLGTNNSGDTTFVQVKYGNGYFYLHATPDAFSNVSLLDLDKYDFAFRSLSYLPRSNKVIWDEYQKKGDPGSNSMFRVMLDSQPLRIALWIILLGLLLFMIFRAKRVQRIIPIIKPPVNSSIEFLDTISNLYYRKKDFETIANKRHAYFLDYIRKNYYMATERIDTEFIEVLSAKSGLEKDKLIELFALHKEIMEQPDISNTVFLKYNSLLEEFYKNVKNK